MQQNLKNLIPPLLTTVLLSVVLTIGILVLLFYFPSNSIWKITIALISGALVYSYLFRFIYNKKLFHSNNAFKSIASCFILVFCWGNIVDSFIPVPRFIADTSTEIYRHFWNQRTLESALVSGLHVYLYILWISIIYLFASICIIELISYLKKQQQ